MRPAGVEDPAFDDLESADEITLTRPAASRRLGCITYTLLAIVSPFVGLFVGALLGVGIADELLGLSEEISAICAMGGTLVATILIWVLLWRSWRRRSGELFVFDRAKLVIQGRRHAREVPYAECRGWLFLPQKQIRLIPSTGAEIIWTAKQWNIDDIARIFATWLDPVILERHSRTLAQRGGEVEFREPRKHSAKLILGGVLLLLFASSLLSLVAMQLMSARELPVRPLVYGLFSLVAGLVMLVTGLRFLRNRGVIVGSHGIRRRNTDAVAQIDWRDLSEFRDDTTGLTIRATDGRQVHASTVIENGNVLRELLHRHFRNLARNS